MKTKFSLLLIIQILFFLSFTRCGKASSKDLILPPLILNVSWTEAYDSSAEIKVVQKNILNFQSVNLGNSRTLRILVPENYDSSSVKIKLDIELEKNKGKTSEFYYAANSEDFLPLPLSKIIEVPNGISSIKVYGIDSLKQRTNVVTLSDVRINMDYKVLYMNDGQDISALNLKNILGNLYTSNTIEKIIVVGIDAGSNRLHEYGTVDSSGNSVVCYSSIGQIGTKAKEYTRFLTEEVIPYINQTYRVKTGPEFCTIMGSSLGGLSAFNIAWMHPELFGKASAFSGSFWWRGYSGTNPSGEQINQARIMQKLVNLSRKRAGMKFWFEAGTNDETSDRDGDGIIDAIDDTKDLMQELTNLGYIENQDFVYVEVADGQHNQSTWSKVLDDFLIWSYKK